MNQTTEESLDLYWPYAKDQIVNLRFLLERVASWKLTTKNILDFMINVNKLERSIASEHGVLLKKLNERETSFGSEETCKIIKPWQTLAHDMQNDINAGQNQVDTLVGKRLTNLVLRLQALCKDIKKKLRNFKVEMQKLCTSVTLERRKTLESIYAHESYVASKKSGDILNDPWLTERSLHRQLKCMIFEENNFQVGMKSLLNEVSITDEHIVEELKRVLEEYALARNGQCAAMRSHMNHASNDATMTLAAAHFEAFSAKNHFNSDSLWQTTRKVDDFPYKLNEIQLLKVLTS
jgi:hypothetical protein